MAKEKIFNVGIKAVIYDKNYGIILLHRNYRSGDYWDMPGGRIDGNESFQETLRRELNEELPGVSKVNIGELLGAFRVQSDIDANLGLVLLYFLVQAKLPEEISLSDEHESYIWVKDIKDMPNNKLNPEAERVIRQLLS